MVSTLSRLSAAILCGSVVFGLAACTQTGQDGTFASPTGADSTSSDPQGRSTQQLLLTVGNGDTVASAEADPGRSQTLYLWEEGNVPATTVYTQNTAGFADDPDFRPSLTSVPVPAGTPVKGAVLINAGGAFRVRSNQVEGFPVAQQLSRLGYQSFVVDYRLRPYTREEGRSISRALRFVRASADTYGIDGDDIAVMGFRQAAFWPGKCCSTTTGRSTGSPLTRTTNRTSWTGCPQTPARPA
jgi:acetyl esterase/lipase